MVLLPYQLIANIIADLSLPTLTYRCRIMSGPFKGLEGIVLRQRGPKRIVLQVSAIAQGAVMELDGELLEVVPQETQLA